MTKTNVYQLSADEFNRVEQLPKTEYKTVQPNKIFTNLHCR